MPHWRFVRGMAKHWHQVRAEPSLVVPCEVGGTAEWGHSRPCLSLERIPLWGLLASSQPAIILCKLPHFPNC